MYDPDFGARLRVLQQFVARHAVGACRPPVSKAAAIERETAVGSSGGL